ncbi:unnamed protein product, partial [Iphiclides podalirius]
MGDTTKGQPRRKKPLRPLGERGVRCGRNKSKLSANANYCAVRHENPERGRRLPDVRGRAESARRGFDPRQLRHIHRRPTINRVG